MLSVRNNTESDRQVWNCVQGSDSLPSCSQQYKEHALQAHPWERMPSCGGKALSLILIVTVWDQTKLTSHNKEPVMHVLAFSH